jgi:hypothetical protein
MGAKGKDLLQVGLAIVFLLGAALACGPASVPDAVTVLITSPGDGGTVMVGQAVLIDSAVAAPAGVDRVDLSVDGQVVRHDTPSEGNPAEFHVSQLWTPTSEGQARVTVVAYDVSQASGQATITLRVVASGGAAPTPAADATAVPGATEVAAEPTQTPPPPVTTEAGCTLDSKYVADLTIPDGTVMSPGQSFVKTWRVRNSGTCDWEAGYELARVSGKRMRGPASVSLPAVAAGDETDVSVNLVAPSTYGTHKGTWRVRAAGGTPFGTDLTVVISVPAPAAETPTHAPTAAPTVAPTGAPTATPTGAPTIAPTAEPPAPTTVPIKPLPSTSPYTERFSQEATLAGNGHDSLTAECPANTVVVGGGFSASPDVVVSDQYPLITGWRANVRNTSDSSKVVRVYAVCLHNAPDASVEIIDQNTVMPSKGSAEVHAKCPAGSVVTGGGWRTTGADVRFTQSAKTGAAWNIKAYNYTSSTSMLYAYAVCLSSTGAKTSQSEAFVEVEYHWGPEQVAVTCPQGTIMTGGGYHDSWGHREILVYINAGPWGTAPDAEWRVYALNDVGMTSMPDLYVYAVCLSLP